MKNNQHLHTLPRASSREHWESPEPEQSPEPWGPLFWGPEAATCALLRVCTGCATMVPPPPLTIALATPWVITCFGPTALATEELALATRIWPPPIATACFTEEGKAAPTGTPTTCWEREERGCSEHCAPGMEQPEHGVPGGHAAASNPVLQEGCPSRWEGQSSLWV